MSTSETHREVPHRGLITVSIMLGTIMQVLDTTIANVALPSMTGDLGASQDTINWVLTSYIVAAAIMTPVTGWLSDRFGASSFSSFPSSASSSSPWPAALPQPLLHGRFRLMQGVFGAAIVPLSQTFLLDINPRERHGQAMAIWGAGIMVGPIIGPTLGGWLTETLNWRWVFFINLPVGIVAFLGSAAYLPNIAKRIRGFDFFGFAMLSLGVGALQLMLDRGADADWFSSLEIWVEFGLALIGFWVFIVHMVTAEHPFIDPKIFLDRNFATGLVFIFVIGVILLASLALLPPMLSTIFGYPTITTGLVMAPRGVGTMISMLLVGRLVRVVDPRILVVTGLMLTAYSLYDMSGFSPEMDDWPILTTGIIQGLGLGLVFVPLSTVAFATLDARYRTDATACSPGAQYRFLHRHLDRHRHADAQRPDQPFGTGSLHQPLQSEPVGGFARGGAGRPHRSFAGRRAGQPPGADDLLRERLQADDGGDAVRRSAGVPAAPAAIRTGRGRGARRAYGLGCGLGKQGNKSPRCPRGAWCA